jgi:hypothetical protein
MKQAFESDVAAAQMIRIAMKRKRLVQQVQQGRRMVSPCGSSFLWRCLLF